MGNRHKDWSKSAKAADELSGTVTEMYRVTIVQTQRDFLRIFKLQKQQSTRWSEIWWGNYAAVGMLKDEFRRSSPYLPFSPLEDIKSYKFKNDIEESVRLNSNAKNLADLTHLSQFS